jgi:hypothetical protein
VARSLNDGQSQSHTRRPLVSIQRTSCPSMSKVRTVAGRGGEFMQLSQSSYCVQVYPIDLPQWGSTTTSTQTGENLHASYMEATEYREPS